MQSAQSANQQKSTTQTMDGYKHTPLGWVPVEWEVVKLKSILNIAQYGLSVSSDEKGTVPIFKMNNFINGKMSPDNVDKVIWDDFSMEKFVLKKHDILFNRTNSFELVGKTGIFDLDGKYTFASYLVKFRVNEKLCSPFFLNYFFNWEETQKRIKTIATKGVSQVNINPTSLQNWLKIPLPPLPEQQKIAAILSTWDKAVELTRRLIEAKEEQKKGLMQRLLTGKVRVKGFGGEWREVHLGEIFKERKQTGRIDLPLLAITGNRGVIYRDELDKKDTSNEDKSQYKRICPGDIGYNTMRMWQGRSAVSRLEGIVSPAYTIVTPKKGIDVNFMGSLFQLPRTIHLFWRYSQGLVDDTLNCKFPSFALVKVHIPPTFEEQAAISRILQTADNEINTLTKHLDSLKEQKKGLMQQLLTGKTRVQL